VISAACQRDAGGLERFLRRMRSRFGRELGSGVDTVVSREARLGHGLLRLHQRDSHSGVLARNCTSSEESNNLLSRVSNSPVQVLWDRRCAVSSFFRFSGCGRSDVSGCDLMAFLSLSSSSKSRTRKLLRLSSTSSRDIRVQVAAILWVTLGFSSRYRGSFWSCMDIAASHAG